MKRIIAALVLGLSGTPLAAELMSGAEFEAYVTGKTLFYGRNGVAYGAEIYHANRHVTWSFLDGDCKDGTWYEAEGSNICFIYKDRLDHQCWTFEKTAGGLRARFTNDPQSTDIYEALESDEDLVCLGPKVGV